MGFQISDPSKSVTTQPEDIVIPDIFGSDTLMETRLIPVYILQSYICCLQDDLVRFQAFEETDRDNNSASYLPDFWHPPKLFPGFNEFFQWTITEENHPEIYLYRAHDLLSAIPRNWAAFNVSMARALAGFSMYDVCWYVLVVFF